MNRTKNTTKHNTTNLTAKLHTRHYVQHNYHDHAQDGFEEVQMQLQKPPKGTKEPFPMKLHKMLTYVDHQGKYEDVVSWMPHGRSFCVHKPADFVEKVMPMFFKQTKWTSFQRQLNLYGFQRLTRGLDAGTYYHEMFLHGRYFLCHCIGRQKVKGTGIKAASNPETEPDFYKMTFLGHDNPSRMEGQLLPPSKPTSKPKLNRKIEPVTRNKSVSHASSPRTTSCLTLPSLIVPPRTTSMPVHDVPALQLNDRPSQLSQSRSEEKHMIVKSVPASTEGHPCDYWTAFAIALSGNNGTSYGGSARTVVSSSEVSLSASDIDEDFELSVSERFDPLLELELDLDYTISAATIHHPIIPNMNTTFGRV